MPENEISPAEAMEIFGGEAATAETNSDELEVSLALGTIRNALAEAAQADGVGVNQLAGRLDIAPSSVSRFMSGDGDMRVSTMVLYGRALGRRWEFSLREDPGCEAAGNHRANRPTSMYVSERSAWSSGSLSTGPATFTAVSVGERSALRLIARCDTKAV